MAPRYWLFIAAALLLADCGTRTSTSVQPTTGAIPEAAQVKLPAKTLGDVVVTENDITDRPYSSLGDVSVKVSKWTIFDADPTRAQVAEALRVKAADMGADAVVLVRYGTVGMGFFSWGEMEGEGRAVVFKK
jgi:uncharacterized protein YbjQ (UPF0145 family)